jgi:hypothetical protein
MSMWDGARDWNGNLFKEPRALFDNADQRDRLKITKVLIRYGALHVAIASAAGFGYIKLLPMERTEIVHKVEKKVVKEERVIVPLPAKRTYEPLANAKLACTGAPVRVQTATVQMKDEKGTTWLKVQPLGDDYTVMCRLDGSWPEIKVGDIIALPQGAMG